MKKINFFESVYLSSISQESFGLSVFLKERRERDSKDCENVKYVEERLFDKQKKVSRVIHQIYAQRGNGGVYI